MIVEQAGTPVVVVVSGLPGTGKSTLADLVARRIGAPSFAGDWLLGALAPHGVLTGLDRAASLAVYYGLLDRLVTRQLMLGQSAVVDCIITDELVADWTRNAARFDARVVVVECVCSDAVLHRRRIEGRRRDIPGWHEVGWDHVQRMQAEFPPLEHKHLTVDAVDPLDENVRAVLGALTRADTTRANTMPTDG